MSLVCNRGLKVKAHQCGLVAVLLLLLLLHPRDDGAGRQPFRLKILGDLVTALFDRFLLPPVRSEINASEQNVFLVFL